MNPVPPAPAPRRAALWLLAAATVLIVTVVLVRLTQTARPAFQNTPPKAAHTPGVPSWIPLYPGAAPTLDVSNDFPTRSTGSLHYLAAAPAATVAAFYLDALPKAGLRLTGDVNGQVNDTPGRILTAESPGSARSLTVTLAPGPNGVLVNISFIVRKQPASA